MTGCAETRLRICGFLWLCAAAFAAVSTRDSACQVGAAPAEASDAAAQVPAFEVASIKPNKSGSGGSRSSFDSGRFTATNVGVKTLLQYDAYGIPSAQIMGAPAWLNSERFDIVAKVDDATAERMKSFSDEQESNFLRQLVQQLLADRFKLVVHWETKEFPVYAIVVAKNGPKLKKSKDGGSTSTFSGNGKLTAEGVTMEKLAQTLTGMTERELGRFVIDKTGIEGKYDLTLTWSPEDRPAAIANGAADNTAPPGPSIFTAIQEQLGLKLESTKGPVQTLVIDHIEQPSEN